MSLIMLLIFLDNSWSSSLLASDKDDFNDVKSCIFFSSNFMLLFDSDIIFEKFSNESSFIDDA